MFFAFYLNMNYKSLTCWRWSDFAITCISHKPQAEYTRGPVFNGLTYSEGAGEGHSWLVVCAIRLPNSLSYWTVNK